MYRTTTLIPITLSTTLCTLFLYVINGNLHFFADAKTEESLTLKIFDPDFRQSDKQLMALLKQADLESHGYRKEVTTKLVSEPGIDKPVYQKSYFYYKIENCSLLQEITKELRALLPGEHPIRSFRDEIYQIFLIRKQIVKKLKKKKKRKKTSKNQLTYMPLVSVIMLIFGWFHGLFRCHWSKIGCDVKQRV